MPTEGIFTTNARSFSEIQAKDISKDVLNLSYTFYKLHEATFRVVSNSLEMYIPKVITRANALETLELQEQDVNTLELDTVLVKCKKWQHKISVSDEAEKKSGIGSLYGLNLRDCARAIAQGIDGEVASVINSSVTNTTASLGVWDTKTNYPIDDILGAVASIEATDWGYQPDTIIMRPDVFVSLCSNPTLNSEVFFDKLLTGGGDALPSVCGLKVIKSNSVTAKNIWVCDSRFAIAYLDGGTVSEPYRNHSIGANSAVVTSFVGIGLINEDAIWNVSNVIS